MRNVRRITTQGKIRPVRPRALNTMPVVDDLGKPDRPDPSGDSLGLAGRGRGTGGRGDATVGRTLLPVRRGTAGASVMGAAGRGLQLFIGGPDPTPAGRGSAVSDPADTPSLGRQIWACSAKFCMG